MLWWSINLFRIAGIQLAVHWSLVVLLGYVAWQGYGAAGWAGLWWISIFFILLFTCVVLHELGHCLAGRRFNVRVGRIMLLPIGGMAEFESIPRRPSQEIVIALAGPIVNFALIAGLYALGAKFPGETPFAPIPLTLAEVGRHLILVNVIMGCFNLIPVFPMDGGRVFRALLALRLPYVRATFYAATVGKVLAAVGAVLMIFQFDHWLGGLLFLFIFVAGELEYRAVQRRDREEARWRRLLEEFCVDAPGPLPRPAPESGRADAV